MRKFMKSFAAAAAFVTILAGAACADVTVRAPSEVRIGRPFLVRIEARGEKLSGVKISWLGREAPLAAGADGVYSALLGSDVKGTEPGEAELAVTFRSDGGAEERAAHRVKTSAAQLPCRKTDRRAVEGRAAAKRGRAHKARGGARPRRAGEHLRRTCAGAAAHAPCAGDIHVALRQEPLVQRQIQRTPRRRRHAREGGHAGQSRGGRRRDARGRFLFRGAAAYTSATARGSQPSTAISRKFP